MKWALPDVGAVWGEMSAFDLAFDFVVIGGISAIDGERVRGALELSFGRHTVNIDDRHGGDGSAFAGDRRLDRLQQQRGAARFDQLRTVGVVVGPVLPVLRQSGDETVLGFNQRAIVQRGEQKRDKRCVDLI